MSTWQITEVDRTDEDALRALWEVSHAADAERPLPMGWPWETARSAWTRGREDVEMTLLGVYDGDAAVGTAEVHLPLLENLHAAYAELSVHPGHRRRGIGSALLDRVEAVAATGGRSTVMIEVTAPKDQDSPGLEFARVRGYEVALEESLKALDLTTLDLQEPRWAELEERPRRAGYSLLTWVGSLPDELMSGYVELQEAFMDEAPTGDLDVEAERWDEQRVRAREERLRGGGMTLRGVQAIAPDGSTAGMTELSVNAATPTRSMQGGTLVLPAHRGHGLGMAMKLVNLRDLREAGPEVRHVITGNAGVNAAMNRVNDVLGFATVERGFEMQRRLR